MPIRLRSGLRAATPTLTRAVLVLACSAAAAGAAAENWRFTATAGVTETFTDNVNFAPRSGTINDFVTSLTAALGIKGEGARVKLSGSVGATAEIYARETQNNAIAPNVNLAGSFEAIEKLLYVDATARVSTEFLSPFGPQPGSTVNATSNRFTSQTYSVNPYVKGVLGGSGIAYEVRDENTWTFGGTFGDASAKPPDTYLNRLTASLTSGPQRLGWRVEYERADYDNGLESAQIGNAGRSRTQLARAILTAQLEGQLQLAVRAGYDMAKFPLTSLEGPIYGVGFQWDPTPRTQMGGFWEHRFFGSAYEWKLSHRLPNSAISASITRELMSFPQNALQIPAGAAVAPFVDAAFTTRIPDPAARTLAVEQFLARAALPAVLASPVNIYSTQVRLQSAQNLAFVITGRRNAVTFSAFNLKSEAIAGSGDVLPPVLEFSQNSTQTGVGVSYSHQLTGLTSVNTNAGYSRTRSNDASTRDLKSNNGEFGVNLTTRFGPKTTGSLGVSYSLFKVTSGSSEPDTDALSVFAAVNHTF